MTNLFKCSFMHTYTLAQVHELGSRQQLVGSQLDVDLFDLTHCGRNEVTGHIRSFGQMCKIPAVTKALSVRVGSSHRCGSFASADNTIASGMNRTSRKTPGCLLVVV